MPLRKTRFRRALFVILAALALGGGAIGFAAAQSGNISLNSPTTFPVDI